MAKMATTEFTIPESIKEKLAHQFLVVRKQAIEELTSTLETDKSAVKTLQKFAGTLLKKNTWQSTQSAFILGQGLVKYSSAKFRAKLLEIAAKYFEDSEHRVREAVADCLGELARVGGIDVYRQVQKELFRLVSENFIRGDVDASGPSTLAAIQARRHLAQPAFITQNATLDIIDAAIDYVESEIAREDKPSPPTQEDTKENESPKIEYFDGGSFGKLAVKPIGLKHDTEGWKCLWSAMKTIERIIVGLGSAFEPEITPALFDLLEQSISHINRFVREVTFQSYAAICTAFSADGLNKVGEKVAEIIASGLGDNWSQVRYASSLAARQFFETLPKPQHKQYFSILLPAMCLNRYYVAAGVRVYSLDTWKWLVVDQGRALVAEFIEDVTIYFCDQARADNHAVREAACHCIAELAVKVDHTAVRTHVPQLLDALIACFKDASWPVRDAACVALGDFVSQFPDQSSDDLDDLNHLWYEHLSDNIPSVREDSAMALGKVIKVLGKPAIDQAIKHLKENLTKARKQPSDSKRYTELENTTLFGVAAKRVRDNDPELHTGQQHYSCGSLAPKLKAATRSGCMDHGFSRNREPWEYSDGSIHLLKELVPIAPQTFDMFIPILAEVAEIRNFAHFPQLQQTIWQCVPEMAKSVGPRRYKTYLELLVRPMVETLECGNRLAMNEAGKCVEFSSKFIGKKFFDARLKPDQINIIQSCPFVRV